jgi:hypothetical protein
MNSSPRVSVQLRGIQRPPALSVTGACLAAVANPAKGLARTGELLICQAVAFRAKGQMAIDLLAGVFADGIRLDFACGDEVYGSCTQLREYLEARGRAYVLRVPSSFCFTVARGVRLTYKKPPPGCPPPAAAGRSARPGTGPRATAGTPGRGWPPPRRATTCSSAATWPPASWPFTTVSYPPASPYRCPGWPVPPGAAGRRRGFPLG